MRILLFILSIPIFLYARENPFVPKNQIAIPELVKPIKKIQISSKRVKEVEKTEIKRETPSVWLQKNFTQPTVEKKRAIKSKPKVKPKKIIKNKPHNRSKLLYNGQFAKIKVTGKSIMIVTKDQKIKDMRLKNPNRIVLDFERFDVVKAFSKKIRSRYIKNIRIGHHDYFYRVTFTLNRYQRYRIFKKSYGYLVKLF